MSKRRQRHARGLKPTRRQFLQISAATAAATMLPWRRAYAFYNTTPGTIPLFGTTFRGVGPGGIPVCAPDAFRAPVTGVTHYTLNVGQYVDPGVCALGPTTLWGYHPANPLGGGSQPQRHLGGIIVAQRDVPIQVTFNNNLKGLPGHIIPLDTSIPGANQSPFRIATHLHGGLVPWISDGGPFDWWDPYGVHGESFLNNHVLNPRARRHQGEYYYPNNQSARFLIMHDHAMGTTRINAYAGIGTGYLIRDNFEINLKNKGLPEFIENSVLGGKPVRELPLIIQDKVFVGNDILSVDPTWPSVCPSSPGSLWYAHTYEDPQETPTPGGTALPLPDPSALPEFFGDTMLCNGTAFPKARVEGGRYRLRILDICNARFLNLQLYVADGSPDGITLDNNPASPTFGRPTNAPFVDGDSNTPSLLQIGTDGGLLPYATRVPTNVPYAETLSTIQKSLLMGPGERADVILNFRKHVGKSIILYNDAPGPFPYDAGDPNTDYFPGFNNGNPVNASSTPGFGPNTRVLMRFDVVAPTIHDLALRIRPLGDPRGATSLLDGNDPLLVPLGVTDLPPGVPIRTLTLNEGVDQYGRLIQMLGTTTPTAPGAPPFYGQAYEDAPTEVVQRGDTEVWEIYNLSADVHPMHIHLVNWQIINRQAFAADPDGNLIAFGSFNGDPMAPDPNEAGWKDTVPMYPGTVTRVIAKFDLAKITRADLRDDWDYGWDNGRKRPDWQDSDRKHGGRDPRIVHTPPSPRTGGHEFVWHCHILEHEEHDMMRPLVVV